MVRALFAVIAMVGVAFAQSSVCTFLSLCPAFSNLQLLMFCDRHRTNVRPGQRALLRRQLPRHPHAQQRLSLRDRDTDFHPLARLLRIRNQLCVSIGTDFRVAERYHVCVFVGGCELYECVDVLVVFSGDVGVKDGVC